MVSSRVQLLRACSLQRRSFSPPIIPRMGWVGGDLEDDPLPTGRGSGTSSTRPGYLKPLPAWPCAPPGMGRSSHFAEVFCFSQWCLGFVFVLNIYIYINTGAVFLLDLRRKAATSCHPSGTSGFVHNSGALQEPPGLRSRLGPGGSGGGGCPAARERPEPQRERGRLRLASLLYR